MLRVGLTGGLASGKSFVGRTLAEMGCCLIRADELGHEVLAADGEAYADVVREFGRGILRADETIDRRKLGALVFGDPERLRVLTTMVQPPIRARIRRLLAEYEARHPDGIALVEAAILIETGSYRDYARLILAVCSVEQQIQRAMQRDGLTHIEVLARLNRQMPLSEKMQYADFVIDTSGPKEDTVTQTRTVYEALLNRT